MNRKLVLEDGSEFLGQGFGSMKENSGEMVFTTAMTGYQEFLTDPSFLGQMVVMTFPMAGNYGINRYDYESIRPQVQGLICGEVCPAPSNFRMEKTLAAYLEKYDIPGLSGIDTRCLTKILRKGSQRGILVEASLSKEAALDKLKELGRLTQAVAQVSTRHLYEVPGAGKRVVVYDFGMKGSILKVLAQKGFNISVVPYDTPAQAALELNPDGILLSNGPGDPKDIPQVAETVRELLGKVPLFGICLGHQLLALACGATTEKMAFGHRGGNNPVISCSTGKVLITSQNHGYVVNEASLENTDLVVSYRCVNDGSIEGLKHTKYRAMSLQFHPEAAPGPQDAKNLFNDFDAMMEGHYATGFHY